MLRKNNRHEDELRVIKFDVDYIIHADGSCLVTFGDTKVIVTATIDERIPSFLKNSGAGWVTAEYGMLPRSTHSRMDREAAKGKQSGRTQEIQRLIGRSLRAIVDMHTLGERQIKIDCDVIQADGGTRTASICGAYIALYRACEKLVKQGVIDRIPLTDSIAAISCGLLEAQPFLDLDYVEDSSAQADSNFVMTGSGGLVEVQATAEAFSFTEDEFMQLMSFAKKGIAEITILQKQALGLK